MAERRSKLDTAIERVDAFVNLATGLGTCEDMGQHTRMFAQNFRRQRELENAYKDLGIARRIVDRPATDATREGWELIGTDESVDFKQIKSDMEDLRTDQSLTDALRWSRLAGGALLIPLVNDGQTMDMPIKMESIKSFDGYRVIDRWRAQVAPESFSVGAGVDYSNPDYYQLSSDERDAQGNLLVGRIHRSRVIRFDGISLPYNMMARNGYWGMSVLDPTWDSLRRLYTVRGYMEDGAHSLTGFVLKIHGLTKMLKGSGNDPTGALGEKIRASIARLRNQWNNMHWLALDKDDGIEQSTRNVKGFAELEDIFMNGVIADGDIPRELLAHELKGALTTGESAGAIRLYYDEISAGQKNKLTPALNRILEFYFAARGIKVSEWEIVWKSLWQMTEGEKATVRKTNAEADSIYFSMGALEADEIRQARLVEGQSAGIEMSEAMIEMAEEREAAEAAVMQERAEVAAPDPVLLDDEPGDDDDAIMSEGDGD